jgi:hypothetical protein
MALQRSNQSSNTACDLSRSSRHLRTRYGTTDIALRDFVIRHAAHVHHRDVADVLPTVATALISPPFVQLPEQPDR